MLWICDHDFIIGNGIAISHWNGFFLMRITSNFQLNSLKLCQLLLNLSSLDERSNLKVNKNIYVKKFLVQKNQLVKPSWEIQKISYKTIKASRGFSLIFVAVTRNFEGWMNSLVENASAKKIDVIVLYLVARRFMTFREKRVSMLDLG